MDEIIRTITLSDNDGSVSAKIYADGSALLKQDDHQVYVPASVLSTLAHFFTASAKAMEPES